MTPACNQVYNVNSFFELVSTSFRDNINALCWKRELHGDFAEIVVRVEPEGNITELDEEKLLSLHLSEHGQLAREILLNDLRLLRAHGASPNLNLISHYERDEAFPFFPTDVYSFHVDRSPIAFDTFLCTYYGDPSEILPNSQAEQKILVPEIRKELKKLHNGNEDEFELFLQENFFDLHYRPKPEARPVNLGTGNMWRLCTDHPESKVLPCIHRAPAETKGRARLLMIC